MAEVSRSSQVLQLSVPLLQASQQQVVMDMYLHPPAPLHSRLHNRQH
jgi:hypothetical protein